MSRKSSKGIRGAIKEIVSYGESLGFVANLTQGGHFKFFQRGCQPVFVSATPSDGRAYKNARADLRRAASVKKCG